jgi:CheY-like chemotaxis protein/two-component sensor histidine kinase
MHDLNNLMTVVVGLSEFGRNETGPQHKTHRYFNQIYDSGQMCVTLARQLLVFNKELNNLQTMDLNETVTGMVPLVDHITGTTIELEMDLRATQPLVKAEYAGIGQIILNLVINARDAMPEGGRLAIISRMAKHKAIGSLPAGVPAGVFVEFIIRDTGSGIPLEIQQRVFEPYFSTKAAAHGTGLGLSIVRRIVERFGGYMTLSSTAGVGTAVHVFMPQVIAERSVPRVEDLEEKTPAKGDIILVVEDEEVIRDLTKKCLEMIGYRILTAPNAVEAMPLFGQHQTDIRLLLVDIKLEGMSGVELLKELRQKKPALKVLIMSGVIGHESVHDLIQMDGCQFIQKPFTTTQLAQAVRQSLTCSSTTIDI